MAVNGRPTKYNKALEKKAFDYVRGGWREFDAIPSHVGLVSVLGISRDTLYDWAKHDDKKFSDILSECNAEQERTLLNMGLIGEYNSNIVKLVLGKHGYNDKQEEDKTAAPQKIEISLIDPDKSD